MCVLGGSEPCGRFVFVAAVNRLDGVCVAGVDRLDGVCVAGVNWEAGVCVT